MVPLYVLGTKIYHFIAIFFQIKQITNLQRIDSVSDHRVPLVSAEVAENIFLGEVDIAPHVNQIKTQKISIKNNPSSPKKVNRIPAGGQSRRRPAPAMTPAADQPCSRPVVSCPQSSSPKIGSSGRSSRRRTRG
jgi:hypothetical protein